MSDSLSQNQVESLLRAVNGPQPDAQAESGDVQERPGSSSTPGDDRDTKSFRIDASHSPRPHVSRESVDSTAKRDKSDPKVQPYDFRQPPQMSRDQIQALHILSDVVAIQFSRSVATLMRGEIDCQLVGIDQTSHQDFVFQMDDPSCYCVINPKPLPGHWMLDIPSTLLFAMIDRMLGGEPFPGESPQRPMTDIEKRLIRRVIEDFLANVSEAWSRVIALSPTIESIENHPHRVSSCPANDSVVRVHFTATVCNVRGEFWFGLPIGTINHLSGRMDPHGWENELCKTPTEETRNQISQQVADSPINVTVNLAKSTISTRDLLSLSVGDVIATEQPIAQPMELAIANIPKFKVRAGAYQNKVAVKIESVAK